MINASFSEQCFWREQINIWYFRDYKYLLTLGTKKTFDSVDHYFLLAIRKK